MFSFSFSSYSVLATFFVARFFLVPRAESPPFLEARRMPATASDREPPAARDALASSLLGSACSLKWSAAVGTISHWVGGRGFFFCPLLTGAFETS